ncbi:hypothetical protein AB0B28_08285 [Glycomyces sp. NPDC046736]|uniref:hypothetical protein n=1 Tax=Glycomyces sp. NPDC046736 TaxID=3155615 RepID=UPI0034065495
MTDTIKRPEWHTTTETARDTEIAELRRRLAEAETERDDNAAVISRAIKALAAEHADAARVAVEMGDDPDQYAAMLLTGQRNGTHRAFAIVLRATLTYASVDEAARRIAEGTAWGQTDTPQYGPDGFTPLCEIGPF